MMGRDGKVLDLLLVIVVRKAAYQLQIAPKCSRAAAG